MAEKYYSEALKELKSLLVVSKTLTAEVQSQKKIQTAILKAVKTEGKTVPEISKEIDVPADKVLWLIAAMRKYGKISENGKKGDYHLFIKK